MNNFEDINLTLTEKYKLFIMRFLIPYTFAGTYYLTQKYKRYCIHCRKIFVRGMFSSFITPIVVSIITSILTVIVLRLLGLQ